MMLLAPTMAAAQPAGTITGTVTNARTGAPIPGASVAVEGTPLGGATGPDGQYEIAGVAAGTYTVVVSFIGYGDESEEGVNVAAGDTVTVDFAMQQEQMGMDEVVVVGYGEQQREDVTGAISSVSAADVQDVSPPSIEGALQGRVSGVQVQQTGGSLQGEFNVLVRGAGSLGGTQPLYVVDGVPLFSGALSTLDLDEVESVEVLKDASATAIYGARAANGVVIIETERGEPGETKVNVNTEVGLQRATKTIDMMNSEQFAELFKDSFRNAGRPIPPEFDDPTFPQVSNDWQDLILRTAPVQKYNLSVTGGDQKTQFAVSGGYRNREGILVSTHLQALSLRTNLSHQVNSKLNVGVRLNGSHQWREDAREDIRFGRAPFRGAIINKPWIPYKNEDGTWADLPPRSGATYGFVSNPVAWIQRKIRDRKQTRALGNAFAEYNILEALRYKVSLGTDLLFSENYNYYPVWEKGGNFARSQAQASKATNTQVNWVVDQTLRYDRLFGNNHRVRGLVGFSVQQFTTSGLSATGAGTTNERLRQISNQPNIQGAGGGRSENGLLSYFARANYDYDGRYLLTATVRRDGSSRFGQDRRFGTFPSASVGWRISEESFMQDLGFASNLKLRASYGLTGDQSIGNFQFLARAGTEFYAWGDAIAGGNAPTSYAQPGLQWEVSKQLNVGLDLGLFRNRVSLTADYYNKVSDDLLVDIPVPPSNGIVNFQTVNLGSIRNRGVELGLTTRNLVGDFSWTTNLNVTTNANEVLDIGETGQGDPLRVFGAGVPGGLPINLTTAGHPIGAFYGFIMDGIWQQDEAEAAAQYGAAPGDVKYRDLNGDGQITEAADRTFLGQPQPSWYGGIGNTLSYHGLSLSVFLNFQIGQKLYNTERAFTERGRGNLNQRVEMTNRWTEDNPSNTYPKVYTSGPHLINNTRPSTRFLEDASFLRVGNVSLGYTLPSQWTGGQIDRAEIVFFARNPFTFTGYSGFDPEVSSGNSPLSGGLDDTSYPYAETYSLKLNLTF